MDPNSLNPVQPPENKRRFNFPKFSLQSMKNMSRTTVLALSLSFILILVGLWAIFFNKITTEQMAHTDDPVIEQIETAPTMGAVVSLREGVVEYSTDGLWDKVTDNAEIIAGMSVRTTGASSRVVITLDDGSVIRLDANTEISFETLTAARVVVKQESGYVYSRVVPSETRDYLVMTENALFESVGTAFRTIASGDEEAVETFESVVHEANSNLSAEEGEKLTVINNANPSTNKTVVRMNIETLKSDAFISWNRELDNKDNNFKNSLGFLSDIIGATVEITEPVNASTYEVTAKDGAGLVSFKGKTEAGSTLTVQSKSTTSGAVTTVEVGADGIFTTPEVIAPLGLSVFEFVSKDKVGNVNTTSITLNVIEKTTTQKQVITLTGTEKNDGHAFNWSLEGVTDSDGVQFIFAQTPKAQFGDPTTTSEKVSSGADKKTILNSEFTGDWYFKVCRYIKESNSCDVYSNEVKVSFD